MERSTGYRLTVMPASCCINKKIFNFARQGFRIVCLCLKNRHQRPLTYYKYTQSYADTNKSKDLAATAANGHLKRDIQ